MAIEKYLSDTFRELQSKYKANNPVKLFVSTWILEFPIKLIIVKGKNKYKRTIVWCSLYNIAYIEIRIYSLIIYPSIWRIMMTLDFFLETVLMFSVKHFYTLW